MAVPIAHRLGSTGGGAADDPRPFYQPCGCGVDLVRCWIRSVRTAPDSGCCHRGVGALSVLLVDQWHEVAAKRRRHCFSQATVGRSHLFHRGTGKGAAEPARRLVSVVDRLRAGSTNRLLVQPQCSNHGRSGCLHIDSHDDSHLLDWRAGSHGLERRRRTVGRRRRHGYVGGGSGKHGRRCRRPGLPRIGWRQQLRRRQFR